MSNKNELFDNIDGICWSKEWSTTNLYYALSYQPASDDVFVVTYPRSGTTWMQNIVYSLFNNGRPFDSDRMDFFRKNPHIEIDGPEATEGMQRPGAIKTHLPIDRLRYSSAAKYVCIIRNPKDVCVSYYLFYKHWPEMPKLTFDEFVDCFIEGNLPFGDYFSSVQAAWNYRHRNNVLILSYEDLRTNTESTIRKIGAFLGIDLNETLVQDVLKSTSFEYMKDKYDYERRMAEADYISKIEDETDAEYRWQVFRAEADMKVVRKGVINDWKTIMSAEQSERINAQFIKLCQRCDGLSEFWKNWSF